MFDLMVYAETHRYRLRNLHDGRPLHPLRVPIGHRNRSTGYVSSGDRMDAIICRRGFVSDDGHGRIAWYLFAGSAKGINRWLTELTACGASGAQLGDTEAAGDAPVDQIDAILDVLKPYRKAERGDRSTKNLLVRGRTAARLDANAPGGLRIPPDSICGPQVATA